MMVFFSFRSLFFFSFEKWRDDDERNQKNKKKKKKKNSEKVENSFLFKLATHQDDEEEEQGKKERNPEKEPPARLLLLRHSKEEGPATEIHLFSFSLSSSLDSVLAPGERRRLLRGLHRHFRGLRLGQALADRPGLLRAEVEREVLRARQLRPDRGAALLRDDGEDAGDALADRLDLGELVGGAAGDLGDAEGGELLLEVLELERVFF